VRGETFWLAVRGNLTVLADTKVWVEVVRGPVEPKIEEPAFLGDAAKALPSEPWTERTWKAWTTALSLASGRKGRALFHPLRLALTARENGPEMARLLPPIGRERRRRDWPARRPERRRFHRPWFARQERIV
jgi:glutamyl-tRNA synthetase